MAAPFNDVTKDIPGYKIILKSVLKSQIQHLVEQLAANTDEESVILTASVSDGTLSHLGSESGNDFLRDHEDIKLQFLGFCLKNHYERRLETQRQETETCSQDSKTHFISNFEDKDEIYTATTFIAPQTSDSIHNVTAKSTSCRSPARSPTRSPRARFEPYMSSKRSRKYLYSLQQDRYRSHVFGQSVFNVPIENIDEENVDTDESRKEVETTKESTAFRFSGPNLKNESGYISDQTLTKCDNDSKFNESDNILKPDNENPNFGQTENDMDEDIDNEDASTCITPVQQCDGSGISISITEANQNQIEISQTKEVNENIKILNVEKNAKRIMVEPDLHRDRENLKAENSVTKRQIKTTVNKRHDENTKETLVIQDTDETSGNSSVSVKSKGYQNIYFDNGESYVSRLRSSRSLRRKVEVNNALKLSHAKRASRRGAGRDNHARVSHTLSMDNVVSNTYDISTTNTESENENLELLEKGRCSIKIEDEEDPLRNTQCKKQKIFDKETEEDRKQEHGTKEQKTMNPELFKQETNSDSESELEIIAIEPGSVFLFKDSLSKLKGPEDTVAKQKKVFIKRGSKLGIKRKKKSTGENVKKVFPKTTSYTKGALSPPSPYVAKLRRFKTSVSKIKPCLLSPKCSNRKPSERLPITKKADHNSIKEHSAGPSTKRAELNVEPISETQISSTQNLNSDEDGELEIPDVDEPDSSNLSDVKSNKLNRHFIEEDTPSPVSLSNSYMESEDNNDELTSDSSVSYTHFSKFAMGTNHTKQDPNKALTNIKIKENLENY